MNWQEIQEQILKELTPEQLWWVKKNVGLEVGDMRKMSTEELRTLFPGGGSSGVSTINDSKFIKTFIWQSFLMIKAKQLNPIQGNLRSFWYRELRPFYKNHDLMETDEGPPVTLSLYEIEMLLDSSQLDLSRGKGRESYLINKMGISFSDFVLKGIFRYKGEFDFQDSMDSFKIIGTKRPRLIFYTEKEGLFRFCQEIAKEYGISAMASRGEPGYLTMEYFADALKKHNVANVKIAALTDYDPWGWNIAEEVGNKMQEPVFGFNVKTTYLTSLDLFDPEKIDYIKRYLGNVSPSKLKQVAKWMKETGGINNEPYGIHVDHADMDKVRKAVDKWYKKVTRK